MVAELNVELNARYSVTETAQMLGISDTTLWRMTRDGRISYKVSRHNGRKFFFGRDILKYHNAYA